MDKEQILSATEMSILANIIMVNLMAKVNIGGALVKFIQDYLPRD
jgi:hypothetical protein